MQQWLKWSTTPGRITMLKRLCLVLAGCCVTGLTVGAGRDMRCAAAPITLETKHVKYVIGENGKNLSFLDKRSGKDYLAPAGKRAFLTVLKQGTRYEPTACSYSSGKISDAFAKAGVKAVVKAACKDDYLALEVESVSDPAVDEISLVNLVVTSAERVSGMSGVASDRDFAVALRTLNLQMLGVVGGKPATVHAVGYRKYGLAGAKIGLVGCPAGEIRTALKALLRGEGAVWSPLGGPWALEAEENRGSYVFAVVSEKNVDEWIALAKLGGMAEIHFIGWEQCLGHYEPRKGAFPSGLAGMKTAVDKIHAAGLKAGMHTLTGCISPSDRWASPIPDPRLAKDAAFTLADPIDEKAATLTTVEKPEGLDTMWAYASRGNVLQVDHELIQYSGLSQQASLGFTGCRRGAFGTKAAPHAKGASAHHLFVRYGSFLPDENSTLVDDVAAAIARVFNTCGFDMIYQDGAEGMDGGWHGVAKMREAIFKKIKRRVLVEASSWGYHEWAFHSRIGAWDHPNWALKQFVDVHCRSNEGYRQSALLPAELGWWVLLGPNQDHPAETPDEFEYLCSKALAYDAPTSFEGVDVGPNPWNARQNEYLELFGRYERLRRSGRCPESLKERLKKEKDDFRLVADADGSCEFLPTDYAAHKITGPDDGSAAWTLTNRFAAQPLGVKIEALFSVEPYDAAGALVLADFADAGQFAATAAAHGVTHSIRPSQEQVKAGAASGCYSAKSTQDARRGAWCKTAKAFSPPLDLKQRDALGVWVYGDGKGALLNIQLTNLPQFWQTYDEHYVSIDFRGWRYFELPLRERDAERYADYSWPYQNAYAVYRSPLIRSHVDSLNLYLNELPPKETVTCYLGPIKALHTVKAKLTNPSIEIGGRRLVFPVTLESGSYLEFHSAGACRVYDERGRRLQDVKLTTSPPAVAAGANEVRFACEAPAGTRPRAKVTFTTSGEPIVRIPAK